MTNQSHITPEQVVEQVEAALVSAGMFQPGEQMTHLTHEKVKNALAQLPALQKQSTQYLAEIERLEKLVYVPGLLRCAKCDCRLISNILNVATGQINAKETTETCPNGCGPMWRVTEREAGNEMIDRYDALLASIKDGNG